MLSFNQEGNMELKKIREKMGITQKDLATQLNIKPTTYNGYEKNTSEPDIQTLIKLADYFHVTVDNLIGHNVPYLLDKSLLSNKQNELIDIISNLSDIECENVIGYCIGMKQAKQEQDLIINQFKRRN